MIELTQLLERGFLAQVDVHVARALCRLLDDDREPVRLAAALACRAPRHDSICAELGALPSHLLDPTRPEVEPLALEWPDLQSWIAELSSSPLVHLGQQDEDDPRPLVLASGRLYLDRYWQYQRRLAQDLLDRSRQIPADVDLDLLGDGLHRLFGPHQPGLLDRQRLGATMAVLRGLTVISGGPGTGKTTTVRRILALLFEQAMARGSLLRVALAAPTGRAAARVKESVGQDLDHLSVDPSVRALLDKAPNFTLHRLLGSRPDQPTRFRHHAQNPLPYDVVVVDEASMVDFAMMSRLVDAVPAHARLILLGDRHQLASVEAGAVFSDLCPPTGAPLRFSHAFAQQVRRVDGVALGESARLTSDTGLSDCMVQLDRFHRFGPDSGIGAMARAIQSRDGGANQVLAYLDGSVTENPGDAPYQDIALHQQTADSRLPTGLGQSLVQAYRPMVEAALQGDSLAALEALERVRVLSPHRRGPMGVAALNEEIEQSLSTALPAFHPRGDTYVGRPFLVRRNDYALGLFNGDSGVIVSAPEPGTSHALAALRNSDGSVRLLSLARLPDHETCFAMTIHKSQGSQFEHTIVVLPDHLSPIVTRELVYTAVTRASQQLTLTASEGVLREALGTQVRRSSGLGPILWVET